MFVAAIQPIHQFGDCMDLIATKLEVRDELEAIVNGRHWQDELIIVPRFTVEPASARRRAAFSLRRYRSCSEMPVAPDAGASGVWGQAGRRITIHVSPRKKIDVHGADRCARSAIRQHVARAV